MINLIIYFIIAFFATTIGVLAGLGGGVIIKPMLDFMGDYPISTINILSTFTVLTMAIVSTSKVIKRGGKVFDKELTLLIIGSSLGGILGSSVFTSVLNNISNDEIVASFQSFLLIIIFISVLIIRKVGLPFSLNRKKLFLLTAGILMGMVATFLGIGGGPINMIVLLLIFSYGIKDAVVKSTIIILFSQLSSLLTTTFSTGFESYDLTMLIVMIPGAILGGIVGSSLVRRLKEEHVGKIFNIAMFFLIIITMANLFI